MSECYASCYYTQGWDASVEFQCELQEGHNGLHTYTRTFEWEEDGEEV